MMDKPIPTSARIPLTTASVGAELAGAPEAKLSRPRTSGMKTIQNKLRRAAVATKSTQMR
jgi:hypothetical protein